MGTTLHTEKDDYLHYSELILGSFELIMLYILFFVYSEKMGYKNKYLHRRCTPY